MTKTLLDRAKGVKVRYNKRPLTEEDISLALAWAKGEVTLRQAKTAWGYQNETSCYQRISFALRKYFQKK